MSKVETGRFSEQLRRMLGQKGQELVAAELSPEISPTIELEGRSAEWDFLKGVRGISAVLEITAVVAMTSICRVRNPAASGVLGVITMVEETIQITPAAAVLTRGTEVVDLAVPISTVVLDERWEATGLISSALQFSTNDAGDAIQAAGPSIGIFRPAVDTPWKYTNEIVLPPGTHCDWGPTPTNRTIRTTVTWRERAVARLEL